MKALDGVRVVSTAINIPGPLVCAELASQGAKITKVQPPSGDPLAQACPQWYKEIHKDQTIVIADLRENPSALDSYLSASDLLITSSRPSTLATLGLSWESIHKKNPKLSHLAIGGFPPPKSDIPTHDIMLQAENGLWDPPSIPKSLIADLGAVLMAGQAALQLLLLAQRAGEGSQRWVYLSQAAEFFSLPFKHGLTKVPGALSGAWPTYGVYACKDGWVALAALETKFQTELEKWIGQKPTKENLAIFFAGKSYIELETQLKARQLPVSVVKKSEEGK